MNAWDAFMAQRTLHVFREFDLSHWPPESLLTPACVTRLLRLRIAYKQLHPTLSPTPEQPLLTPEEVFRRHLMTQIMSYGAEVRPSESVIQMRERLRVLYYRRQVMAEQGYQDAKATVEEMQASAKEIGEFLEGIDFD